jgi:hypothetical protein
MNKIFLYPFLAAALPIIGLFSTNLGQVVPTQLVIPLVAVFIGTGCLLATLVRTFSNPAKAAVITAVVSFMFLSYGHFANVAKSFSLRLSLGLPHHRYLLALWLAAIVLSCIAVKKSSLPVERWTRGLNYFLLIMVLVPVIHAIVFVTANNRSFEQDKTLPNLLLQDVASPENDLPDIYYIVPDRYARGDILESVYGFDNSLFLEFLANKGFYVAHNSYSNYLTTSHSLASSLNMRHLSYLTPQIGRASSNWLPLYRLVKEFRVIQVLRLFGYEYIHSGDWWGPTAHNVNADRNINLHALPEFASLVYKSSMLYPLDDRYLRLFSDRSIQCERTRYKFKELRDLIGTQGRPKFVFAHMLIPHGPAIFDRHGRCSGDDDVEIQANYREEVAYVNKELMGFIEAVLNNRERRSIIILQADEGPYPERLEGDWGVDWHQAAPDDVRTKTGILNAYYFPDRDYRNLYPSVSPVNSFRLIFRQYFGFDFELLPDEIYAHKDATHVYDFVLRSELAVP